MSAVPVSRRGLRGGLDVSPEDREKDCAAERRRNDDVGGAVAVHIGQLRYLIKFPFAVVAVPIHAWHSDFCILLDVHC